jgi:hypothetical protein
MAASSAGERLDEQLVGERPSVAGPSGQAPLDHSGHQVVGDVEIGEVQQLLPFLAGDASTQCGGEFQPLQNLAASAGGIRLEESIDAFDPQLVDIAGECEVVDKSRVYKGGR